VTELVRNSFFQFKLRFSHVRIGIAVGPHGVVVAVQAGRRRWLIVIGQVA